VSAAVDGGTLEVTFNDGSTAAATIVGTDAPSDLAVIKVAKTGLAAATLGTSSGVHVGDPVLAVGSPLGLSGTVTSGIVSALNRPVNTTDQGTFQGSSLPTVIDAIQTDAAINPGNSGGPLVNAAGQVIGINSAIASLGTTGGQSGNIGVGFSIPIDQARSIASQLMATGHASHPMLGVSLADATTGNGQSQALVQQVQAGSPAAKAGLKTGDVIVAVGDQRVDSPDALIAAIRAHNAGDTVRLTVLRDGKQLTMSVTLAEAATSQG
jgi:putative serine protease PepD